LEKVPTVNFGEANFTPQGFRRERQRSTERSRRSPNGSFGDNHISIGGATIPLHQVFT